MNSDFLDLSDKIARLAEMTLALRRENAILRQTNSTLAAENAGYVALLGEVERRVGALLETIPAPDEAESIDDGPAR